MVAGLAGFRLLFQSPPSTNLQHQLELFTLRHFVKVVIPRFGYLSISIDPCCSGGALPINQPIVPGLREYGYHIHMVLCSIHERI